MDTGARDKLIQARAGLVLDDPFWGSLSLRLRLVEDASIKTAFTEGRIIAYNPAYINGLSIPSVKTLLGEEVGHCMLGHVTRLQGHDADTWNAAADNVLYYLLKRAGFDVGQWWADPRFADFDKWSADRIYDVLSADKAKERESEQGGQGQGQGKGQGKGQGQGQGKGQGKGQGQGQGKGQGKPGGFGGGQIAPATAEDGSQACDGDRQALESEWRVAITQAVTYAKSRGSLPGWLTELCGDVVAPRVPWYDYLHQFFVRLSESEYSWLPPSRRWLSQGVYLPALKCDGLKPFVLVLDTSGSMSVPEMAQGEAELTSILSQFRTACQVLYCDTRVIEGPLVTSDDKIKLEFKGRGGTCFQPAFDWVKEHDLEPSCLIYITDLGASDYPSQADVDYPVLWVATSRGAEPPIGETVYAC